MLRNHGWFTMAMLITIGFFGCSKPTNVSVPQPDTTSQNVQAKVMEADVKHLTGPAAVVYQFLDAVRRGNDDKATKLLSTVAREKAAALNRNITPPASDTARFSVGKVEYISEDGAQVSSIWSDVDDEGQSHSDEAIWVLRREEEGWRVAGVAATIFPGEPPLLLNFEDPEDMLKKQQWVHDEIKRRAEGENLQAKEPENTDNSVLR